MVVKQEQTGNIRQVTGGSNINDTYALFLKESFQNFMDATYIPPAMKQQYRQEAIDAGLLSAPSHIA